MLFCVYGNAYELLLQNFNYTIQNLLTIVTVLYVSSAGLIHLITESLYIFTGMISEAFSGASGMFNLEDKESSGQGPSVPQL